MKKKVFWQSLPLGVDAIPITVWTTRCPGPRWLSTGWRRSWAVASWPRCPPKTPGRPPRWRPPRTRRRWARPRTTRRTWGPSSADSSSTRVCCCRTASATTCSQRKTTSCTWVWSGRTAWTRGTGNSSAWDRRRWTRTRGTPVQQKDRNGKRQKHLNARVRVQ